MAIISIETSGDAGAVLHPAEGFLNRQPAENNLVLSILHERAEYPEPGRYWTVSDGGQLAGLALQSPPEVPAVMTAMPRQCLEELATAVAAERPGLPGVFGEAATASRFAACWAERLKVPVAPVEAQRLYRLTTLRPPAAAPGFLRTAGAADFELLLEWLQDFHRDTGGIAVTAPETLRRRVQAGRISIWEDGKPVSMASVTKQLARTVRVSFVYTQPSDRGRGYATSCVAAVSRDALDAGASGCVLFTQLTNPQSNAIYRRLGYEPVLEQLRYRFGP